MLTARESKPKSEHLARNPGAESAPLPRECSAYPVRQILGVPIHALTMEQVLDVIDERIRSRRQLLIGVVNAAKIVNMDRDPELAQAVLSADMIFADGMSVVWASRLLKKPLPERVPGIDLMHRLFERGGHRAYRVYLLGARQEVLDAVAAYIQDHHPGLIVAGSHHGYFGEDDEPAIAERVRSAKPDILFVAMTSPRKERFLARWFDYMEVPVCHGVGGAFDVVAGKVRRAPAIWQKCGMEWLYRVIQEPRRMWRRYLVTNTLFCWMLFSEIIGRRRTNKPAPPTSPAEGRNAT